jgi:hypothetical protein
MKLVIAKGRTPSSSPRPTCCASYDLHATANSGEHWVYFGAAAELPPVAAAAPSSLRVVLAHPARPTIAASATRVESDLIWRMSMSVSFGFRDTAPNMDSACIGRMSESIALSYA